MGYLEMENLYDSVSDTHGGALYIGVKDHR